MDKETLVAADIDTGQRLMEELARADYPAEAAFWLYDSDVERWHLWISTPKADVDLQEAYMSIHELVAKLKAEGCEIDLQDITLASPSDSLVKALDKRLHMKDMGRLRLKSLIAGRYYLEDLVVYRTAA